MLLSHKNLTSEPSLCCALFSTESLNTDVSSRKKILCQNVFTLNRKSYTYRKKRHVVKSLVTFTGKGWGTKIFISVFTSKTGLQESQIPETLSKRDVFLVEEDQVREYFSKLSVLKPTISNRMHHKCWESWQMWLWSYCQKSLNDHCDCGKHVLEESMWWGQSQAL